MTRDEAKMIGTGNVISISDSGQPTMTAYDVIIDRIYDEFEHILAFNMKAYQQGYDDCKEDFESRTCENCKWFDVMSIAHSRESAECTAIGIPTTYKKVTSKFGCNKFERKEK